MSNKFIKRVLFASILAIALTLSGSSETFAKTKTYGYSNPNKDYMYNQAANWWNVGDGSSKNGSAINAFAAAMSILYNKKITPASVAKIAYQSNIWNHSGATPEGLISNLTTDQAFDGIIYTKAAGSSTSVRLAALAKSFAQTNGVVIARATGKNPFHNGEAGGHYILIMAYKSDGTCLVYDPAQSSISPKWGSAKTLFNQMNSNIMFWVISKGNATTAENLEFFNGNPEPQPVIDYREPKGDNYDDDEGDNYGESEGKLAIKKESCDPGITNGNSSYQLNNATFEIYKSNDCSGSTIESDVTGELIIEWGSCSGTPITTLTTGSDGKTPTATLPTGHYWVKETTSPRGYQLSSDIYGTTVTDNNTAWAYVCDAPEGDNYNDDDDYREPEGDNYYDDDDEDETTSSDTNCIINPNLPNCTQQSDESRGDQDTDNANAAAEAEPSKAILLADNALKAAWPVIGNSGGYCYNDYGVYYKWNTYGLDYHNKESCGTNVRHEYKDMLSAAGINNGSSTERQKIENLFIAVINAANIDTEIKNYLDSNSLLKYLETKFTEVSDSDPEYGDVIYTGSDYYIYIGDKGGEYGDIVTSKINAEVPHIDEQDPATKNNARIFRLRRNSQTQPVNPIGDTPTEPNIIPNPKAATIADLAREIAWPTDQGKCYDKSNQTVSIYSVIDCYHYQKSEYKTLLSRFGLTKSENELESESVDTASARFLEAVLRGAELEGFTKEYVVAESSKDNGVWQKVNDNLVGGDLIKLQNDNNFYIYIGALGGSYGNVVGMNQNGGLNPYVQNINSASIEQTYRLRGTIASEPEPEPEPEIPPVIPPEEENTGDAIAARAMSFSWPYTKYSTDDSELWGKCVKKYNGTKTKYSKYPSETTKSWKLKTYPTGTSCNKTLPPKYAEYRNITDNSKLNSGKVSAIGFIRNIYASLGIAIPYYNITDIRSKLATNSNWELITDKATKNTEFLPGDLLVSKDTVGIYVGEYGEKYGKVVQAYYGKWVGRATPLYLKSTYVFRVKSTTQVSEEGVSCPEKDNPSGNDKIATAALKMSWPNITGSADEVGKCKATNGSYVKFPEVYKYTTTNIALTAKKKSASTLASERKKTTCDKTYTGTFETEARKYLSQYNTSSEFLYTVMRSAGVNWFEPNIDTSNLSIANIFKDLKADTDHFTVVSKKVKNTKGLLPGDILINSETKNGKTYSDMLIYVGKANGTDCMGRVYGSVIRATSSETPHLQTIYYKINNSSSRSNFWVFRAKESAYGEVTTDTPGLPDPEVVQEEVDAKNGDKIAIRAVEFSWPFTKYSSGSDNSTLNGKCIQRGNRLVAYPDLKSSGTQNNGLGGYIKDEFYTNTSCQQGFAPLYLKWIVSNKTWTINDMLDSSGKYSNTIQNNSAAWNALVKATGTRISGKNDCIGFVRNVLSSLGMKDIPSSPSSAYKKLNSDWKLIGTKIEVPAKDKNKNISHFNSPKVTGGSNSNETLKPGDIVVNDHHIFIFLGDYGGKWGNRADANSGTWWGGQIHSIYTYDGRVYNSGNNKVFRYVGKDI